MIDTEAEKRCREEWATYARNELQDDGESIVEYSFLCVSASFTTGFHAGREHETERRDGKIEGLEEDLRQLIRVALTNPADLRGFIQANYPKEYAELASGLSVNHEH